MSDLRGLKEQLHRAALDELEARRARLLEEMKRAQEAANEETKSSAGDKYETGRAMLMLEKEKLQTQLESTNLLLRTLNSIDPAKSSSQAELGALVETEQGYFYLSTSLGQLKLNLDKPGFVISMASPLGQEFQGKRSGERCRVNGREIQILSIG